MSGGDALANQIIPVVGSVCFKGDQVLLIQRGKSPYKGRWSLPGGHIEPGERAADAALRELAEETSIDAELIGLIDVVDGIFKPRGSELPAKHYLYVEYACRWTQGEPKAGDDAAAARFFDPLELGDLDLMPDVTRIISLARPLVQVTSG
ncbi:MAG: NUDIX hydrolase [Pseudomonadota bacterium]